MILDNRQPGDRGRSVVLLESGGDVALDATAVFVHEHDQTGFDAVRRLLAAARTRTWPAALGSELRAAMGAAGPLARAVYRRRVKGLSSGGRPERVTLQVWVEQAPGAESRVTLDTSLDPLGMRRPRVDWRVGPLERETTWAITRFVDADLRRLGVGELRMLPTQVSDKAFAAAVSDAFHPSGRPAGARGAGAVGGGEQRFPDRWLCQPDAHDRRARAEAGRLVGRSRCRHRRCGGGWLTRSASASARRTCSCGRTTRRGRPRCWPRCSRCLSGSSTPHSPTATAAQSSGWGSRWPGSRAGR